MIRWSWAMECKRSAPLVLLQNAGGAGSLTVETLNAGQDAGGESVGSLTAYPGQSLEVVDIRGKCPLLLVVGARTAERARVRVSGLPFGRDRG